MSDIAFRYTGSKRFAGVPARDLTQADYDDLSPELRRVVLHSGSYQKAGKKQSPVAPKAEGAKAASSKGGDTAAKKDGE